MAASGLHKKLGPLETWQWLAIGAAVGLVWYVYRARKGASSTRGTTPAAASTNTDLGPLDPTTGQPYALEAAYQQGAGSQAGGGGTAQNAGPMTLAQELSDLGAIQTLFAGFNQSIPATATAGTAASAAGPAGQQQVTQTIGLPPGQFGKLFPATQRTLQQTNKQVNQISEQLRKLQQQIQHNATKPKSNPGHTVTTHPGGKQTVSSSAPHNARQHQNVAPPAHQRANPTSHPSQPAPSHPAAPHQQAHPGPAKVAPKRKR